MRPLITIVIPVYNVEQYIGECLDSVLGQTYENIEIILINDGSTDCSSLICDEYASRNKNVFVIHQENSGVSRARNKGIEVAKGSYVAFVDSDDVISPDFIESLFEGVESDDDKCILPICGYTNNIEELYCQSDNLISETILSKHVFNHILNNEGYDGYVWNKLFNMEVLINEKILFPESIEIWEDMYFVVRYLQHIKKTIFIKRNLYYYRYNKESASNSNSLSKVYSRVKVAEMLVELENNSKCLYYVAARKLLFEQMIAYLQKKLKEENIALADMCVSFKILIKLMKEGKLAVGDCLKQLIRLSWAYSKKRILS